MSVTFSARLLVPGDEWAMPVEHLEEVNLNNGNAVQLLALLELRGDWTGTHSSDLTGEVPAADFAERVALAAGLDLVGPRPGASDGRWHHVGASADYLLERLGDLGQLARSASALTTPAGTGVISWG